MTEEVAALVLEDNRLQTLALSLAERDGAQALPSHQRVIQLLEASGRLDRAVEGLPDDEQLLGRLRDGRGLARPELAVLLAYAKLAVQDAIRSEEHTSELQSLMRISYAVFCLKKKKKKQRSKHE